MNILLLQDGALWASWGITIDKGSEPNTLIINLNGQPIAFVENKAGVATLYHDKGSMCDLSLAQILMMDDFLYKYFFGGF